MSGDALMDAIVAPLNPVYQIPEGERFRVASDANTAGWKLEALAFTSDARLLDLLADNPATPVEALWTMWDKRYNLLSPESVEALFYRFDGLAYDLADDGEAFRKQYGDIAVWCVEQFCEEEGVDYWEDSE